MAVVAVLACLIIPALAVLLINPSVQSVVTPPVGYAFTNPLVNESFNDRSDNIALSVNNNSNVYYAYGNSGLYIRYNTTGGSIYLENHETNANTIRLVLDTTTVDLGHIYQLSVQFSVNNKPGYYYKETIDLYPYLVKLLPEYYLGANSKGMDSDVMSYPVDAKNALDIVISVRSGNIVCQIDGHEYVQETNYKAFKDLAITNISISSSATFWDNPNHIYLKSLQIGQDTTIAYGDGFHKTITPWGKDFTVSMQLHADHANPAELALMKQLADEYGVRGEFDAWSYNVSATQYSLAKSQAYINACLALKQSGWDIGTHAVADSTINRTKVMAGIALFEKYFGPLRSWTDHGEVEQDMVSNGSNASSQYYSADYLTKNDVMTWVDNQSQSHSKYDDLNYEGTSYSNSQFPGLDLFRTSNEGILRLFDEWNPDFGPVTESSFYDRLKAYADERSTLVWHDYTWRLVYVQDGSAAYSYINTSSMGYQYNQITGQDRLDYGADVHANGTWKLLPVVQDLFACMKDKYNVWFATPQEVDQRSKLIQATDVSESDTAVSLTNRNTQAVDGFTFYTKSKPDFYLTLDNKSYYAKQSGDSWAFVLDSLPANKTVNLIKASLPASSSFTLDFSRLSDLTPYLMLLAVVVAIEVVYFSFMKRRESTKSDAEKINKKRSG